MAQAHLGSLFWLALVDYGRGADDGKSILPEEIQNVLFDS